MLFFFNAYARTFLLLSKIVYRSKIVALSWRLHLVCQIHLHHQCRRSLVEKKRLFSVSQASLEMLQGGNTQLDETLEQQVVSARPITTM